MQARSLPLGRALGHLPEAWALGACRPAAAAALAVGARFTATTTLAAAAAAAAPSAAAQPGASAGASPLMKEVLVYRWSPEKNEKPKYDSFKVDLTK